MTGADDETRQHAGANVDPADRIPDPAPRHTPLWALLSRWLLALEAWLRSHGGPRLRLGLVAFWAAIGLAGGVLLFGPVINPPLTLDDITDSASHATDRWIARSFDVDYVVERGDDGRLTAAVTETIGAFFPDDVDEHGIVRVLPTEYQGHALDPTDVVATLDGTPIEPSRASSPDQLTLTLDEPGGTRLDGDHEFTLSYTLHDLAYVKEDKATGGDVDLLAWDVFGPSWPQAVAGIDVSVSISDELADALVRQPRASVSWSIIGGGDWLDPDPERPGPPGTVTYGFTNDQNLPPHASAGFSMAFAPGTLTMPPPTPLFLLQTFGPVLPLVILLATLLLALAARAVAWSDARGRPWFVAQSTPPKGVGPRLAAQVLRRSATLELATALDAASDARKRDRPPLLRAAARAARRAGRAGDAVRARRGFLTAAERRIQFSRGLRRVPTGFVRDLFIAAPLALTVLQWGIVRQLSHQTTLSIVWWPAAFVLISSVIALIVLAIALSARPLTRSGALVKQHLRGIGVYAERTQLLDRTAPTDALLPYAVLLENPRDAGRRVSALIEAELGDPDAGRGWRTLDYLSGPRLAVRTVSVLLVAATIAAVALLPNPYPRSPEYLSYSGDLPGTYWQKVDSFEADAVLSRADDGRARLAVTETLQVTFDDGETSEVPQFTREWSDRVAGQELGVEVESVRVDGEDAPYAITRENGTVLLTTRFAEVLSGPHDLEIRYASAAPVVAAPALPGQNDTGTVVDRIRWAALLDGWESNHPWDDDGGPEPLTIRFTLSDDLYAQERAAGWISEDTDSDDRPRQWAETAIPFDAVPSGSVDSRDGSTTATLDLKEDGDSGYPFELTLDDVGVLADFPAGTFTGPSETALRLQQVRDAFPLAPIVALGALALLLGIVSAVGAGRRGTRRTGPGFFRDLVWWLGTATALATVILFPWATSDMPDDWVEFPPLGFAALAALVGGTLALVFTRGGRGARDARAARESGSGGSRRTRER